MHFPEFDIVVPSIGESSLHRLLESISLSTVHPTTVYLVLRNIDEFSFNPNLYNFPIQVLHSPKTGQVNQRILGFCNSTSPLVLQVDADCYFTPFFLSNLLTEFLRLESKFGPYIALSPSFVDCNGNAMFSNEIALSSLYRSLLSSCNLLFRFKNLSCFGQNFALNFPTNKLPDSPETFCSDWLPGGCMLQRRSNLVTQNYYPFIGKAYAEDLIHSYLLTSNSISLFVFYGASLVTASHPPIDSFKSLFESSLIYLRLSRNFCTYSSTLRILSFLILIPYLKSLSSLLFRKVLHKFLP